MQKTLMSLVIGVALAGVAVGPSIAGQSAAVQDNMHKQQVGRAEKALENALTAVQASGDWGGGNGGQKEAAQRGIETAITECHKEMARFEHK